MKRVLIISPYFPPFNAADMQRIRMSLPYFKEFGWEAEIVTVAPEHADINQDSLLTESIPPTILIHRVKAVSKRITSKLGLGSIALRSLYFYYTRVNKILANKKFDLVYFSTTQFPVCVLGAIWKKKWNVPYVIDVQDPWHSTYYEGKPKSERPSKYWFSYRLNKYLEPKAMKDVDGLISVSAAYIKTLKQRYPAIKDIPAKVITFGAFEKDFEIAERHQAELNPAIEKSDNEISILYIGRGGQDMLPASKIFFEALKKGLNTEPLVFKRIKVYFIGTSYAASGQGTQTIQPLANEMGLQNHVLELTDRISFYRTLITLKAADILFIPGSDDPQYTASKIYPYLMAQKPLISLFHSASSAAKIIKDCDTGLSLTFDMPLELIKETIIDYINTVVNNTVQVHPPLKSVFKKYSAQNMTKEQVALFEQVLLQANIIVN